ncbi:mitochondrial import receptor subunit TOM70 [Exaiptasia diaphana]|uniref:Mitochondrial import receptor subunit TOM70 n=1 Tax=Exaiptasia diaphana TaxID=2652724 RepID=A0A913XK74_EXADI|nr:mitochondrial import receptor subunit TOM70 [Exaiptasia diaphana]KXJ11106.1 Mitochondrial import receptor subunit TOM70 [Exaiptasia diaphana]
MSEQETSLGLTKWQLGLLIGVPVAVVTVAGVIWYLNSSDDANEELQEDVGAAKIPDKEPSKPKEDKDEVENMTPAEKAQAAKLKGNKYFKARRFTDAIKCYSEAIELCPEENKADLSTFYQNRAAAFEQMGQFENVINEASKALELNNRYTKALMRRARAYEQQGKKEECLQDLTAVCLLEGFNNPDWMVHADRVLKSIGKEKASTHFKNRKPVIPSSVSIKAYLDSYSQDDMLSDSVRNEEGVTADMPFILALDDIKERNFDNIVVYCTQEIGRGEDSPFYAKAVALRATMYTLMSQIDDAMCDLDEVINMNDDKASIKLKINCLLKRASLKAQQGTLDNDVESDFQTAITLDSTNSDIYHQRGLIYFLTEKLEDARLDFEKCIELNPDFVQAKIQLAYCIYKKAQIMQSPTLARGAMEEFERISKDHPDSPDALGLHAQALQEQGQFEDAMEKYEAAHKIQPENPVHLVYKGLLMVQWKQDFEKAVELVQSAIDLDKKCDFAYETLATLEVQRGNLDKAVELFDQALLLVRTEAEMAQTYALREAAIAQNYVTNKMGIKPNIFMG